MEYLAQGGPFYDRSNTLEAVAASNEFNKRRLHDPPEQSDKQYFSEIEEDGRSKRMKRDEQQTTPRESSYPPSEETASTPSNVPKKGGCETECQQERIKVALRVRPMLQEDKKYYVSYLSEEEQICVKPVREQHCVELHRPLGDVTARYFDTVFSSSDTQHEFYEDTAAPLVQKFIEGYNATLLTYGQTGAGKTYSVFGSKSYWEEHVKGFRSVDELNLQHQHAGIVPRAIKDIFQYMDSQPKGSCRLYVSFAEIYMEKPKDLLDPTRGASKKLPIRQKKNGEVYLDGLRCCEVFSPAELMVLVSEGVQTRMSALTRMNSESSRSHAILQIYLDQDFPGENESIQTRRSTLNIVDLAGSENVAKSKSTGLRLEEVKLINKSITALGNVISALAEGSGRGEGKPTRHIPFRDSILTRLLTDSVGGNSYTVLCANIAPIASHIDESFSTVCFATRAMSVNKQVRLNKASQAVRNSSNGKELNDEDVAREARARFGDNALASPGANSHSSSGNSSAYDQQLYRTVELLHGKVEKLNEIIRFQQQEIMALRGDKSGYIEPES
eukprot:gb/GECG01014499.1/.p1 GENE.gb/GECG01014499.1/~~gb/GECG01014499.1/.p1  ORF type:complete len:558 (+),score=80.36 gb/GECG01014499.1/:1-1674(+)